MLSRFSDSFEKVAEDKLSVVYEIRSSSERIAEVVGELEKRKKELGVVEWSLSQPTLDDVFIKVCGEADVEV